MPKNNQIAGARHGHIALASLTAALTIGFSHQAMAACTPIEANLSNDADVTCTGTTTAPYWASGSTSTPFDGVTITNTGSFTIAGGTSNRQAVNLNGSDTTFINKPDPNIAGSGSVSISGSDLLFDNVNQVNGAARTFIGVQTSSSFSGVEFEKVLVQNYGSISATIGDATHSGVGSARGVYAGEDIESMSVENSGTIKASRGASLTTSAPLFNNANLYGNNAQTAITFSGTPGAYVPSAANAFVGTTNGTDVLSVGRIAGIESDDDVEKMTITNKSGGLITGNGDYAYGIYMRAGDVTINNNQSATISSTGGSVGHVAISAHFGGDVKLNNSGTITGDVQFLDANAAKEQALREETSKYELFDGTTNAPQGGKQFIILDQLGVRDSVINNFSTGTINGDIYLGSGEHTIFNAGTINGDISVDQRSIVGFGDNGYTTNFHGDREFKLELAQKMGGDVTVTTATTTGEEVTIAPHIFGQGGGTSAATAASDGKIGYIDGTLKVWNGGSSTIDDTTSIAPVLDGVVKSGEWYVVAKNLFGSDLPGVEGTALVSWNSQKVGNALVIGSVVADASDIEGISKPGAATINALIDAGGAGSDPALNALGGAVQMLAEDSDVVKAGKQLSPETNFATQQAAITLNNAIGQHIDTRLSSVGATGTNQGYTNAPYGLGMKPQQTDPNRSNLGGSLKDDPDFVAPRSAALWGQAFGAGMNQNERQDVDGYDARIYGLMVGYDNWISPGVRLGIAGGYANTRIDGEGDTTQNHTGIDSYLIQAYGAIKGSGWYASGRTGFTWHDYDTLRVMNEPIEDSAKGTHDGDQFNASVEIGAPMAHSGTIITPVASLTYSRLHQNGYSETSDGAMGLAVGSQTNDSFVSGLGLKGLVPIANDTVIEGRALWLHEFADNAQIVNASFAAGGGTFTAAGPSVGRDSAGLGIGMLAQIGFNSTFEINYDANIREDYLAHVGSARLDVRF